MKDTQDVGEGFSSVDLIYQCLIDEDKFNAFEKVLKKHINTESTVLEFGTGSGILSLLSARLGAKKVTAVEFDPYVASIAEDNIKNNKFENVITVLNGDARNAVFPNEKFDVVVMEMLATGLVDEMQVLAMNNLYEQNALSDKAVVIPFAQENYITLAQTDFSLYGFEMKMIRHLWSHDDNEDTFSSVSEKVLLNKIVFSEINKEYFESDFQFTLKEDVTVNSVCLTSKILVDDAGLVSLESTHSLNPIVLIPLEERKYKARDTVNLNISYKFGGGFKNFNVKYL